MPASDAPIPPLIRADPAPGPGRTLLHGLYDLVWVAFAVLGAPWLLWKSLVRPGFGGMVLGRLGRGLRAVPRRTRPRILVHGVSVGEVKAARALIEHLRERHPGFEVVLSTTTDTGLEVARQMAPDLVRVRFPADLSPVVQRFLTAVDPALVILVELEVWPNFLRLCNRQGRPIVVVNGRITQASHDRYLFFRLLPEFNRISLFCVQSEEYARRFAMLGVERERIVVTGNVKFDGLRTGAVQASEELRRFVHGAGPGGRAVLVAGSTHDPEELMVARAARAADPALRLVLVPRHPHRAEGVAAGLVQAGFGVQRLTELRAGAVPDPGLVLLVDTIGELEGLYALADLVYVGGSLVPHGGQNMLEPAVQGKACLFGPHVENFVQEAALLLESGAARQVPDARGLEDELRHLLADPSAREAMGRAGVQAVAAQRGATRLSLEALESLDLDALLASAGAGG
jgi:3-deoxy-D-manno-octulosonic-acid transferase